MKIYVVTHKKVEESLPKNYEYIQAGAALNNKFCELTDNTGDNISEKNPYYCELTAAYWIWKNDNENDIVGLMHYRRFLTRNVFSSSYKWLLPDKKVNKLLKKYDFISMPLVEMECTQKEDFLTHVRLKDFNLMRETVQKLYPDYIEDFDKVFAGYKSFLCNIFICKKEQWDKYHSWLFSIFAEMEKYVDMTGYTDEEKRLYGYLAERLFTVYIYKNGFSVKNYRCLLTEVSVNFRIKRKLKKIFRIKD